MEFKNIYLPKENKSVGKQFEYFRSFINFYYYLLLNNINQKYKIKENYKSLYNNSKYFNFFYDNFINEQNILIFTLYNNIPLNFLSYPDNKFYIEYYPVITFFGNDVKCIKKNKIKLNSKYFPNNLIHISKAFLHYKKFEPNYPSNKTLKKFSNKMEYRPKNYNKYDYMNCRISLDYLKNIENSFLQNKKIFLQDNELNLIISESYIFDNSKKKIILKSYYLKISAKKYKKINEKKEIFFENIIYLSILDKITKNKLINCFTMEKLKKNMIMYNSINVERSNKFDKSKTPLFYTINLYERPLEPLNLKSYKYFINEYKLIKDVDFLNITNNILFNNSILLKNEKIDCILNKDLHKVAKYCDVDMLYQFFNYDMEPNYNKKLMINLILWKNTSFINRKIGIFDLLLKYNLKGYINNFSYLMLKKKKIKKLSTEFVFTNKNEVDKYIKINKYDNKLKNN